MPIKKRTRYREERVLIRTFAHGPKEAPYQRVETLRLRDVGEETQAMLFWSEENVVWEPVEHIDPDKRGGIRYQIDLEIIDEV